MKHTLIFAGLTAFCFLLTHPAHAVLPNYGKPKILVRANGNSNFNLPPWTFLSNVTPTINNQGDVAVKLMSVEAKPVQGLWYKSPHEDAGKIVFQGPEDKSISDASLNDLGQAVFSISEEGQSEGLFVFDPKTGQVEQRLKNDNKDIISFAYPTLLNDGSIYFRSTHTTEDHSLYSFKQTLQKIVTEGEDFKNIKASYLFGPSFNNQHQSALKVRLGNRKDWGNEFPDQVVLLEADGSTRIVATPQALDPNSKYKSFGNSVSLSENGLVVFVGILSSGKKALVLDEQGVQSTIATEGQNDISELELFSPIVNTQGLIAFRAKDSQGKRGIYLANKTQVRRLIGEGDLIPTDLGTARIKSDSVYPAFSGGISLNDHNQLCIHALIVSEDLTQDWGSAIYRLSPL